jgi:hypothetical protein
MFTALETYSPAVCDAKFMLAGAFARVRNQGIHTGMALAGRSPR